MSKKIMLLALSVVSAALFALPAIASANLAHIDQTQNFTVTAGPGTINSVLESADGTKVECLNGVTGTGSWHTTTTGTLSLSFTNCRAPTPLGNLSCSTHTSEGGTDGSTAINQIKTTLLQFHLIDLGGTPGVLVTPALGGVFAHFTCGNGLVKKTVHGNGVLGTITTPACGVANSTATLKFEQGASTGLQKHTTWTGVDYHLTTGEGESSLKAAQISEARIHFPANRTINCTTP